MRRREERGASSVQQDDTGPLLTLDRWGAHRLIRAVVGNVKVDLRQEFGDGIGSSLWPSSVVLGRHLLRRRESEFAAPLRILELGSGCGLTAITLSLMNAGNQVFATDKKAVLPLLRENVGLFLATMSQAGRAVGTVQVAEFDWFAFAPGMQLPVWSHALDLIVLSDCLYSSAAVAPLGDVLTALLLCPGNERTRVVLANERRTALDEFMSSCRRSGEGWHGRQLEVVRTGSERDLSIVPGLVVPVVVMATQQ